MVERAEIAILRRKAPTLARRLLLRRSLLFCSCQALPAADERCAGQTGE